MSQPDRPPRRPVPDLWLEQYLVGELPERHADAVAAWVATDEGAARLDSLRRSNDEILARHPPRRVAASITAAAEASASPRRRWLAAGLVAALCLAVALGGWWWTRGSQANGGDDDPIAGASEDEPDRDALAYLTPSDGEDPEGIRVKGLEPRLVIYRQAADGEAERLTTASRARAGDLLQVAYVAAARPHGVIVSIDGRGNVFLHAPHSPDGPTALEVSGEVALGEAYKLDDAPRFERFFFVTSSAPIEVERIVRAARQLAATPSAATGSLALPESLEQTSVLVEKTR